MKKWSENLSFQDLEFEDTEVGRERNKRAHNLLERKRRRDLNDTFEALHASVHVAKQARTHSAKMSKREILDDAIEKVQNLKVKQRGIHDEWETVAAQNRRLKARLRELEIGLLCA